MSNPQRIELLAPARTADIGIEAILHGADAVYIGAPSHGARAAASNSLADIRRLVEFAHRFDARVYATLNTIVFDRELAQVERLAADLYRIGVDALIVQDMALLRMHLPPIALHASTQCDIRTAAKARFLEEAGFSQLVLARETSLKQLEEIRRATSVPLEVFVHGALCVSYSGDCQASFLTTGRSANRGECAQICRLPFDLVDAQGNKLAERRHLLSLRDMNRLDHLEELVTAGATSFKIEGRLKSAPYVKNVVAAYSRELDRIVARSGGRLARGASGRVSVDFDANPSRSFNRGFTDYFLSGQQRDGSLANFSTPKSIGEPVGTVAKVVNSKELTANLTATLSNGDGLGYFDAKGEFQGFRLNRVEGAKLFAASPVDIAAGTTLYRNRDKAFDDLLERPTATRITPLRMVLRIAGQQLALDVEDDRQRRASATIAFAPIPAEKPQAEQHMRILGKLGGSSYRLESLDDRTESIFIPASQLTALRRAAIGMLDIGKQAAYMRERRAPSRVAVLPPGLPIDRHANVANRLAADFYRSLGAKEIEPAIELQPAPRSETRAMQTRYCLRRELGACLRTPQGKRLPSPLFIVSGPNRFRLDFDCENCRMDVIHLPKP